MADFDIDDVRAGVAAGVIDEVQATKLIAIANGRQGHRVNMGAEDEPFELFKGFSEVFVTVGLGILFGGILAFTMVFQSVIAVAIATILLTIAFASYFTLRRRMTLPSIALALVYAGAVFGLISYLVFERVIGIDGLEADNYDAATSAVSDGWPFLTVFITSAVAMFVYFWRFRVPFGIFLFGLFCGGIAFSISWIMAPEGIFAAGFMRSAEGFFDLNRNPTLAWTLLLFGIGAFLGGMYFDLKDPYRISRYSSCGFWLHIIAAPAIVNVVTLSLLGIEGTVGYLFAALALTAIAIVSLIIDRRSFLTAGIVYIGAILLWALNAGENSGDDSSIVWAMLIMGAFITALGTWWVQLRAWLMKLLPNFPLKTKLPPYREAL